jgi:hypothetical protein
VIKTEVSRGVRPSAKTKNVTKGGATGQSGRSGDGPDRTWRRLDSSLDEAITEAAFKGSGVQRFVRECPAEEDGTVLQTQVVTFFQNESDGLHRADAQIFLPWFNVEGRGKMTWTVCLGEAGWNKTKVFTFPPQMIVFAQEGHKFRGPLGGGLGHQERPLSHKTGKGETNRPVLKNAQNFESIPQRWVSPARGPLIEDSAHQPFDERVVSNLGAVDWRHRHGNSGLMDAYGTPLKATIVEVCKIIQNALQRRLMEKNGGRAEEGLEGLPSPFIAVL